MPRTPLLVLELLVASKVYLTLVCTYKDNMLTSLSCLRCLVLRYDLCCS